MRRVVPFLLILLASTLSATVFDVPTDRALVESSDLIVIATPVASEVERGPGGALYTVTTLHVDKRIAGESGTEIRVRERGGWLDGRAAIVPGTAQFTEGKRVLLFLSRDGNEIYHTQGMALGKFDYVEHDGEIFLLRGLDSGQICSLTPDGVEHAEIVRSTSFVNWISEIARTGESEVEYRTDLSHSELLAAENGISPSTTHRADYLLTVSASEGTKPVRWPNPSMSFKTNGSQSGVNGLAGSQAAAGAWSSSGSDVSISVSASSCVSDCERTPTDGGEMAIILGGNPSDIPVGENFVAGVQYYAFIPSYTLDGESFYPVDHADIIVSSNFTGSQALFDAIITHEMGHAIGIRHSNQGSPSSSNAVMNSSVSAIGASLQTWDLDAVQTVYGNGPACRTIDITGQSSNKSIGYMDSATLAITVSSNSTNPSYQWYEGSSSDFSQATPISGATSSSYNTGPLPAGTYYYFGKAFNECSFEVSSPIQVSVSPCLPPTIVTEPSDKEIAAGDSTILQVTGDGSSPLSYQWYRGMTGSTASPVLGAEGAIFHTGPLNATSSFWVQITNSCGVVDSRTATVTVTGGCDLPVITQQPASQTVTSGSQVSLSVAATGTNGTLSYQWFQVVDEMPVPVGSNASSFTSGPITEETRFFVEVSDSCGTVVSNIATIGLLECQPPVIDTITPNAQIRSGATADLEVEVSGDAPFSFQWYRGLAGDTSQPINGATSSSYRTPALTSQSFFWVRVTNSCASINSSTVVITPVCLPPDQPTISIQPPESLSGVPFVVRWSDQPGVTSYELQESTTLEFTSFETFAVDGLSRVFSRTSSIPTRFFYRVRGIADCDNSIGAFSRPLSVAIVPPPPPTTTEFDLSVPEDTTTPLVFEVFVPGTGTDIAFTITTTIDWLTVSPSSGILPAAGRNFTVTADPTKMQFGSNIGTFTVVFGSGKSASSSHGTTIPVTVSLVTPVQTDRKTKPSESSMIIPGVAHAAGSNDSLWQSDVRLLNVGTSPAAISLKYVPAGANGFQNVKSSDISLKPGVTTAFNDISKNWYGVGSTGDSEVGSLEIRPSSTSLATIASSRTFNKSTTGTFGQFIPPIPFFRFIDAGEAGQPAPRLSMQQISQGAKFRTNVALLEAAGETTGVMVRVFNGSGNLIRELPFTLAPGELKTLNSLLGANGIEIENGRLEVVVTSGKGRVNGYASVVDNLSSDPFLVPAVDVSTVSATRWVLPGVADFQTGQASWRSDVRIYNGGSGSISPTLTFYPQGAGSTPISVSLTIAPGEVKALNNILRETFDVENVGGALHVTTTSPARIVATGRTYDLQATGTYGQFIPAVTNEVGFGRNTRAAYVLQLEQSERFRSNLGLAEITGKPVLMKITASVPGLIAAPSIQLGLQGFEFTQLNGVLTNFLGTGTAFNASITVEVIGGDGKIVTYGSVIDNITQDPTYVPGQ